MLKNRRYPEPKPWYPKNKHKYKGDPYKIISRSSWETKVFNWMDSDPSVLEWHSEELFIYYLSPVDNKIHNYIPDFLIETKDKTGNIETMIIEIKPKKQSLIESKTANAKDRMVVAINHAKWQAAMAYCKAQGYTFRVITEDDLFYNGSRK